MMVPNNYPYYLQNQQMQNFQQFVPQNQPQIQSPFISVKSEAEARNFPVGFGHVVSFKDENAPYVYTKAMGFSQSDKPVFEKYRRESDEDESVKEECHCNGLKEQLSSLETQIVSMQRDIDFLKERKKGRDNEHNANGKSN